MAKKKKAVEVEHRDDPIESLLKLMFKQLDVLADSVDNVNSRTEKTMTKFDKKQLSDHIMLLMKHNVKDIRNILEGKPVATKERHPDMRKK